MDEMKIYSLGDISELVGGILSGDGGKTVKGLQDPGGEDPERLVVCRDKKSLELVKGTGVPLVCVKGSLPSGSTGIEVQDVEEAFVELLRHFSPSRPGPVGIHPSCVVADGAKVSLKASVGPLCVLSAGCEIDEEVSLEGSVFVGQGASIGKGTIVEAGAVIREGTIIGEGCVIHSGAVIGCDGFGFRPDFDKGHVKIPQIGRVKIGDRVEIGACVTIDRATVGETLIGSGTVIDDHVHVGHNAKIGENCILVAMTGIAGSAVLEDGVIMAARSGVADHVTVGTRAQVAAYAGATRDVPPGALVSGFPARDHREELKNQALLRRLPKLVAQMKSLLGESDSKKELDR